jgi:hypothetical protein
LSKLDWHHVIHFFHFLGIAFLLALPVSSIVLWLFHKPGSDLRLTAKFAELLVRLDTIAKIGAGILLVSGIGQIWAHGIGAGDIFGSQLWLGIKLCLFALLVLNGILFAGPALRSRVRLIHEVRDQVAAPSGDQLATLERSYRWTQITGSVMIALIVAILVIVLFQPFSSNPM